MLTAVRAFFARDSTRERHLSNQIDRLELELAMARRENEALSIQMEAVNQLQLRNYPATGKWARTFHNLDINDLTFENPIEAVLSDVEESGYDVSAAWSYLGAIVDFLKQYQGAVYRIAELAVSTRNAVTKVGDPDSTEAQ